MKMHFTKMLGVCCGLLALLAFSTSPVSAQCVVDGGELISTAPDNRFCLGSESPLIVQPELVGNVGDNSLWVLTPQENKTVLASSTTGADWDLNDFADGNYRVWHVSYADGEDLADVLAAPWNSGPGCWDNSNAYRVRLRSNEAVTIASDSETSFCAGEAGDFDATKSPNMGANGVWALTDDSGEAVEIKWNNPNFDLDALAPGTYTVYFVNWSPNFNPIPTVTNLADLEACVGVSNGIELTVLDCTLDCPELGGNIGDACDLDGEDGIINEDCECEAEGCVEVPVLDEECLVDIDSEAYAAVIADDPFCCDVSWDALCQSSYAAIACAPEFDCPELEANIGDDCGSNGTVNDECECIEEEEDCLNTSQWPTSVVTLTGLPGVQSISTCNFRNEYAALTNVLSGESYTFGAPDPTYITLRQGTFDGPVVASGFAPLSYTTSSDADLFPHYNTDEFCGTATGCIATTVECTTCTVTFDCPDLEANIGDDCGENGTVSEDCECIEPDPVANDNCADATPIACGETANGSTANATFSDAGFCGTGHTSPEVWYVLTLENDAEVTANTFGSTFDTKLTVWSGSCEAPVCVGGNDDTGGLQSQVVFEGTAGTTYYLMVHGFGQNTGDYILNVTCEEDEPGFDCPELEANIGDDCGDNGTVNDECECVEPLEGDNCASALPIACGDLVVGTTVGASFSDAGFCGTGHTSPDVWHVLTLADDAEVEVNTFGSAFDTKLTVWTGSCSGLTCVGGNDDTGGLQSQVTFEGTAGTTYYIMVHGFGSATGVYNLEVVCETPPEFDCPELGANLGDPCTTDEGAPGTVNEFCECEADEIVCDVVPEGIYFCQVDINSAAFAEVQATDPFCCNNTWDGLCQSAYDELGGPANPDPACEETFDCPELEANIGDDCGENGTINDDCECIEASPIANDTCAEATPIACGGTATGSTVDASFSDAGFCGTGHTSPEVWYVLTPDADGVVDVNTFGSTFDTKLTVWTGSCGAPVCVGGNDDTGGLQSQVIFDGTAGTTYYIMVHGFGQATGSYELSVTCTPYDCPDLGANIGDECDAAGEPGEINEACECEAIAPSDGCTTGGSFGTRTISCDAPDQVITGSWANEYSTINGIETGLDYVFTLSNAEYYVTVANNDGTEVLAFGQGEVTWTATFDGTVRFYTHVDAICSTTGGSATSHTRSVSVLDCPVDCDELGANIGDFCELDGGPGAINEDCECAEVVFDGCNTGTGFQNGLLTPDCDAPVSATNASFTNYHTVAVQNGANYTFSSPAFGQFSLIYITILNAAGDEILASGVNAVNWTADFNGNVRFRTDANADCTSPGFFSHTRTVAEDCESIIYDCPALSANIGDNCDLAGELGEVNEACECVALVASGCTNGTSFGTRTISCEAPLQTVTGAWALEYSTINGIENGNVYTFTLSNADYHVTVASSDGTEVLAFGQEEVVWTATFTGTVRFYSHIDAFCTPTGGSATSHTRTVTVDCDGPAPDCTTVPDECVDTDSEAYATVIANDPFCCDDSWDGVCQSAYDALNDSCSDPAPDCEAIPDACVDTSSDAYATVVNGDPFCCDTEWDSLCQASYDELSSTCDPIIILDDDANGGATLSSYPNPTPSTSFVTFTIDEPQQVTVEVYDMSGRRIQTLFHQSATANQDYVLQFDGSGLPSGIYIYRLTTESEVIIDKFMIRK